MTAPDLEFITALPIPDHLISDVCAKLAYVDEAIQRAEITPDGQHIRLWLVRSVPEAYNSVLEEKVQRVVVSMAKGAIKPKIQVLEDYMDRPTGYALDPTQALLEKGEISQEGQGIFGIGPLVTRLIEFFESHFLGLASSFGAAPYRFPTLIPAHYLERVGYFRSFPHSLTFATHLREDLDVIDEFSQHAACGDHGLNTAPEAFAQVQALLSPAVCYHLYFSLADRPLPNGKLVATAVGNCFRYEASNLTSLERLWNFTMREVIFVGPKDWVLENRELGRQRMRPLLDELGLAYRVESATDPFFIGDFRKQVAFQSAFQLKFEIRAALPFKNSTLAVGSYNHHQDFFGRALNITLPDGSPAHTGCIAFGLERMAFAFLSQYGVDPRKWPHVVREALYA